MARFRTLNPHQLAGHVANLDFWSGEVAHCLQTLDGYKQRFDRLKAGQVAYVTAHNTILFDLNSPEDFAETPKLRRIPHAEQSTARRELTDAFYYFLVQCYQSGLLDPATARQECQRHNIGIDPQDFQSPKN